MLAALILSAAATLVVPYFEVSVEPENSNFDTRFTIENTSDANARARINVWTDRDHPVLYYTTLLEPRASKTISMRELLVSGMADICAKSSSEGFTESSGEASRSVPGPLLEAVRCQLTTGCHLDLNPFRLDCTKHVGDRHAHAIGYVTIDAVTDCMDLTSPETAAYAAKVSADRVLTGTFEQIANGGVLAKGPLIDREGGPVPPFKKPRSPRDPLAKRAPRNCPPLSPPGPHF
jgi:hypothetical protein